MAQVTCNLASNLASCRLHPSTSASRTGFFQGTPVPANCRLATSAPRAAALSIEARYRGKGTDLSKVDQFKRHEADVGSTEIQIARLTARVNQLTGHLQTHRKDYASTRGLIIILGQRRRLLQYIYKHNRPKYEQLLRELKIRPLKVQAARGVVVKLTEGSEVVVMGAEEMEAATV
ncbi:g2988 [Coccomyxa elongata]